MQIQLKLSSSKARLPSQSKDDIGFDLYSTEEVMIPTGRILPVDTGLYIAHYQPHIRLHSHEDTVFLPRENECDHPGQGSQYVAGDVMFIENLTVWPKIEGRSSLGIKGIFPVGGVIDPTYRGELRITLANMSGNDYTINVGDRIAQMVFYVSLIAPSIEFELVDEVKQTKRGNKGFGSSGR